MMKYKCLVWGMGDHFQKAAFVVKQFENNGTFDIVGVTSNTTIYSELSGFGFIDKKDVSVKDIDVVVAAVYEGNYPDVVKEAVLMGFDKFQIVPYWSLCLPGFDMDRYIELRKNPPSILAMNCWGGLTYHSLGMEFKSPCINLSFDNRDFMRFADNWKSYLSQDLEFEAIKTNELTGKQFPIAICGDIKIHFDHYDSFESAKTIWEKRKKRINEENIFVMMHTEDREIAKQFLRIKEAKKICFVPFETEEKSLLYVPFRYTREMRKMPFNEIVNGMARGQCVYYNVVEMLLSAKMVPAVNLAG